jgi:hypothetical protein
VALTFGARGGVYIAGGISPRIIDFMAQSEFRDRFEAKGRLQPYLKTIPTYVIVHPAATFLGLKSLSAVVDPMCQAVWGLVASRRRPKYPAIASAIQAVQIADPRRTGYCPQPCRQTSAAASKYLRQQGRRSGPAR